MSVVATVVVYALYVFLVLMFFRFVMGWVFTLNPSYRPRGVMVVLLEVAYTATDPPVKALRRVLPPLRLGSFSLDLGFIIVLIVTQILIGILNGYR